MTNQPLATHTLAEAYLYLLVTPCSACQSGPLHAQSVTTEEEHINSLLRLDCVCSNCNQETTLRFRMDSEWTTTHDPPVVNPTGESSKIIDVAQWLTLFHTLITKAGKTEEKTESRRLGYEAALCLLEALKFYEEDNDFPPVSAFFSEKTRDHARQQPDLFARQRLINLRAKLPNLAVMAEYLKPKPSKKWWNFWK